tara:strand:+ start:733 stop:1116 length:384 start_codon:yes stop_codon:yes gene_type:complete
MYHTYPYKAQIPIIIDGEYQTRTFTSKKDVEGIIELLIDEVKETNQKGNNFNIVESIVKQLPFFACPNVLIDKQSQNDISRYIYSEQFGISPYSGSFGNQPSKWVVKSFLIKNAIERRKAEAINHGK